MADKNVVRQDVVQIEFDINDKPMKELIETMKGFKKTAKNTHDDVSKGWEKTVSGATSLKKSLTPLNDKVNKFGKTVATAFGNVAKKAVLGLGAAITAVGGIAIKNYADYEQLVGGVETLFKESQDLVMQNANKAFKEAGLSANDYMDTVTSFSASLLQSLGGDTAKAAEYAHIAITDMSDNANKMGTDMSMIQNAYQGFAKQNYTMLDNLKLGYGGTKTEMERLIKDAAKLDKRIKANDMSFSNIVLAINAVQKEMGIYGTTSKEASSTIQGSVSAMKAAWTNFTIGLADPNQDLDMLMTNLVDSVVTAAKNIVPRVANMLPTLLKGMYELISTLAGKAKEYLIANKDQIWLGFKTMVAEGISALSELFTGKAMDVTEIMNKIEDIKNKAFQFVEVVKNNWPLIKGVVIGIVAAIATLKAVLLVCNTIIAISTVVQWAMNSALLACPVTWLVIGILALIAVFVIIIKNFDKIKAAALDCWNGLKEAWGNVKEWFSTNVLTPIIDFKDRMIEAGKNLISGLIEGIKNKFNDAKEAVLGLGNKIANGFKDFFGINSPSKLMEDMSQWIPKGAAVGIETNLDDLEKARQTMQATVATPDIMDTKYTPNNTVNNSKTTTNTSNNYNPVFNLTVNGGSDSRETEFRVKQWVREAMNEVFSSMNRTNPRLTEV